MKKIIFLNIFIIAILSLSGCSTIHFDKGAQEAKANKTIKTWHHNVALGLYEVSPVVNLPKECGPMEWTSVKTELTFINSVAGGVVNNFIPFLWYPKTVEVYCN